MNQQTLPQLEEKQPIEDKGFWKCEGCGSDGRNCGCSAFWHDIKEASKKAHRDWRDRTSPKVHNKLDQLRDMGFAVKELTPWQFRINDRLDIFWQSQRYHDIKKNKRGDYKNLTGFIKGFTF